MKKNDTFELKITDIGADGEGIGRAEGFTWFVKDAIPGDTVEAAAMKIKKTYGFARLKRVIEPSQQRVNSQCPIAGPCGGCSLQSMNYAAQLSFKQKKVRDCIERIGDLKASTVDDISQAGEDVIPVLPVIGMDEPWRYRNKAQLPVGYDKSGRMVAGFYAGRTHSIIPQSDCLITFPENAAITRIILDFCEKNGISAYDEAGHTGLLRHILLRKGFTSGQIMVCLVINGDSFPKAELLAKELKAAQPGVTTVVININRERTNVILGRDCRTVYGPGYITDNIGELSFRIDAMSFFQVNPVQTLKLYSKALEFAGLTGSETVWDLYCGAGTISLFLAKNAANVRGVEIIPEAVEKARENARANGVDNAVFYSGRAEEVVPRIFEEEHCHADVIVVDPPRKGCDGLLLQTMAKMEPERIAYVSCDPATLARDLKILKELGYETMKVQPVDMFPQTPGVEVVSLLQRMSNTRPKAVTLDVEMEDYYRIKGDRTND